METRKFSSLNARGILPGAQQVLAVLLCLPGEGTYLGWDVPTLVGGTYLGQGVPTLVGGGVPTLERQTCVKHLLWRSVSQGAPTLAGGTYLGQGVPTLAGGGVPTLDRRVPTLTRGYLPKLGTSN